MEPKNNGKDKNEVVEEDRIELPPDTLAILNEFLHNKSMQEPSEIEEDWV